MPARSKGPLSDLETLLLAAPALESLQARIMPCHNEAVIEKTKSFLLEAQTRGVQEMTLLYGWRVAALKEFCRSLRWMRVRIVIQKSSSAEMFFQENVRTFK